MASADSGIAAAERCVETAALADANCTGSFGVVVVESGRFSHCSNAVRDDSESVSTSPPA